jgi:hypothetical protein
MEPEEPLIRIGEVGSIMKQTKASRCLLAGALALAMLSLSSCSEDKPLRFQREHFFGRWAPDAGSRDNWIRAEADRPKCQIDLRQDGTFAAAVPDYMLGTVASAKGLLRTGTGTWTLASVGAGTRVELRFRYLDGKASDWTAKRLVPDAEGEKLSFGIEEPDSYIRFVLERQPGENRDNAR